jgi:hypothetical protein
MALAVFLVLAVTAPAAAAGGVPQRAALSPIDAALSALHGAWSAVVQALTPARPVIRPNQGPCMDPNGGCTTSTTSGK